MKHYDLSSDCRGSYSFPECGAKSGDDEEKENAVLAYLEVSDQRPVKDILWSDFRFGFADVQREHVDETRLVLIAIEGPIVRTGLNVVVSCTEGSDVDKIGRRL